ncbi:hypothetical protein BE11_18450 [Sorangium cellulosum]|nr:hypothetical protein BE11_18450 [Sorangium cellulosum]
MAATARPTPPKKNPLSGAFSCGGMLGSSFVTGCWDGATGRAGSVLPAVTASEESFPGSGAPGVSAGASGASGASGAWPGEGVGVVGGGSGCPCTTAGDALRAAPSSVQARLRALAHPLPLAKRVDDAAAPPSDERARHRELR